MKKHRIVVYSKDVACFTGKSTRSGCETLKKIRLLNGKEPWQEVTYLELAEYLGIEPEEILKQLD